MKLVIAASALLFSLTTLGGPQWGTPLCRELFDVTRSDASYNNDVRVINSSIIKLDTMVSGPQAAQILVFYYDGFSGADTSLNMAIEDDEHSNIEYRTIIHVPTGKTYNHVKFGRGDTEVSAIFIEGVISPIAFTGDGECFQVMGF